MASTQDAIAVEDAPLRRQRNKRLRQAVHRHKAVTRRGIQERLFTLAFSGLVYPQIWEDPVVDLEALHLKEDEHLVAIASGGCNVLSYLAAAPVSVTAIDLNPAHVALNKLKLAALAHLPDYAAFRKFFAEANRQQNIEAYFDYLRPHLDAATRNYWESRDRIGRRRIGYFGSNLYRHGLLGNFIGAGHLLARAHGKNPRRLLAARTRSEQQRIFDSELAPLFRKRHIRWLLDKPSALFGLGIPPSQFTALKGAEASMADVLLARLQPLRHQRAGAVAALSAARGIYPAAQAGVRHDRRARLVHRASRRPAVGVDRRLRVARCARLDDRRAARRAVERNLAHRAARSPRHLPHRRRGDDPSRSRAGRHPRALRL